MKAEALWEILKNDFGITSRTEFDDAYRNFKGLDVGLLVMPWEGVSNDKGRDMYQSGSNRISNSGSDCRMCV